MSETGAGGNALMRWEIEGRVGWGEDQNIWSLDHYAELLRALRNPRDR